MLRGSVSKESVKKGGDLKMQEREQRQNLRANEQKRATASKNKGSKSINKKYR